MKASKFVSVDENILIEYIYDDGELVGEAYNIVKNTKSGINSFVSATPNEYLQTRDVLIDNLARQNVENTTNIIQNQLFIVDQQQVIYGKFDRDKYSFLQYREYPTSIPIRYDTIKIHLPVNYTFFGYLGCYIRVYTLDYTNSKFVDLSNYHFNLTDINQTYNLEYSSPYFIFKEKPFGKYLKVKIPSVTKVSDQRVRGDIRENTINFNLTDGVGLSKAAPVFIDFHFIESIQFINSFPYFQLTPKRTIAFPQTPEFEKIGVVIQPSTQGDFFIVYGTFNGSVGEFNQFMNDSVYYGNKYYCEFTIDLYEKNILVKSQQIIVTEDFIEEIEYRPIIKFSTTTAIIDVTLKIIDNSDFSEIVRKASYAITNEEVSKYSANLTKIDLNKVERPNVFKIKNVINTKFDESVIVRPQLLIEKLNFNTFSNQLFLVDDNTNAQFNGKIWISQNQTLINIFPFDNILKINMIATDQLANYIPFDFNIYNRLQITMRSDKVSVSFPIYRDSTDNDLVNGVVVFKISGDKYEEIRKIESQGFNIFYINGFLNNDSKIIYSGVFQLYDSERNISKLNDDFENSQSQLLAINVNSNETTNKKIQNVENILKNESPLPKGVLTDPNKNKTVDVKSKGSKSAIVNSELTLNKTAESLDLPKDKNQIISDLKTRLQVFWNPIYAPHPDAILRQRSSNNKGFKVPNNLFSFKISLVGLGWLNNSMSEKEKTDTTNILLGYFKGINLNPVKEELDTFFGNPELLNDLNNYKVSATSNTIVETWWGWNGRGKAQSEIVSGELSNLNKQAFDILNQIYEESEIPTTGIIQPGIEDNPYTDQNLEIDF